MRRSHPPAQVSLARDSLGATISWGQWALAGLVPGLICLLTAPAILYFLYPPEVKETPDAPAAARKELEKLGELLLIMRQ
jgi:di/tricarboxylate transporter